MTKTLRKRLSLFISFLMMAFVFCQGMAQATVVASAMPQDHEMAMMACHDGGGSAASKVADCPSDCQHLDKAVDSGGHVLSALDYVPVLIGILLPPVDESSSRPMLAFSPPDSSSDPPLTIRFRRFRL